MNFRASNIKCSHREPKRHPAGLQSLLKKSALASFLLVGAITLQANGDVITETLDVSKVDVVGIPQAEINANTALFTPCSMIDVISEIKAPLPTGVLPGTVEIESREHVVTWFETIDGSEPLSEIRQTTIKPNDADTFINGSSIFDPDVQIGEFAGSKNIIEVLDKNEAYIEEVRLFTFLNAYTFSTGFQVFENGVLQPPMVTFTGAAPPQCTPPASDPQDIGAAYIRKVDSKFTLTFKRHKTGASEHATHPVPAFMTHAGFLLAAFLLVAAYQHVKLRD